MSTAKKPVAVVKTIGAADKAAKTTAKAAVRKAEKSAAAGKAAKTAKTVKAAADKAADKAVKTATEAADKAVKTAADKADKAVKTVKKTVTRKKSAAVKTEIVMQVNGGDWTEERLIQTAKDVWQYDLGRNTDEIETIAMYVKPEEKRVYAVINGKEEISFAL